MNKRLTIISTLLLSICLSACFEKTQTVEWYVAHPETIAEEMKKCRTKTLAEVANDQHCIVIIEAQRKISHDHQRNAPIPSLKFKFD